MMTNNEPVHWLKLLLDFGSVCLLFLSFQLIKFFVKPFKSSFYCNDYSINMPFRPSTVTNFQLILLSLCLPFVVIIATEISRTIYSNNKSTKKQRSVYKVKFIRNKILEFPEQIGNLYVNCGAFFFGLVATAVITDLGKVIVGRLRPNFIDVCQPDVNPYTQLCAFKNKTFLIPGIDFKCTAADVDNVEESRLSFPSGHSSLSFYSMIYLILFINCTWRCRKFGLLPRLIQITLLILAIFTSLSRISDHKHHPTDVLAGACLGIVLSFISFIYLTDYLKNVNLKMKYSTLAMRSYDEELMPEYEYKEQKNLINNSKENDQKINASFDV